MNAITCTGQQVQDFYEALALSATASTRCVVVYALNLQSKVSMTCFHAISNGDVLACYELSDALTESQFLALIDQQAQQPMQPIKVDSLDLLLGKITCTMSQYAAMLAFMDDVGHLYSVKQTDKIDRAATTDPNDGGRVTVKAIISDAPTVTAWLANVSSIATEVDNLTFDTP